MVGASDIRNERTYHTTQSVYILPNDDREHRRLEATAERIRGLLDEKIVHAPVEPASVHKVIDIGCGTGATTDELGTMYSRAKICGVDLSPVPTLRPKLDNIEYLRGDIMELAATATDNCLTKGTFDYVFSRFLMGGITDWKAYIDLCISLARPGAWIELQEPDMAPFSLSSSGNAYDVYPKIPTLYDLKAQAEASTREDPESWRVVWHNMMRARGLEPRIGTLLGSYLEDAGLEDVQVERYVLPFGTWEGMTEAQGRMAPIHEAFVRDDAPGLIRKLGSAGSMSSEEVDKVIEELRAFVDRFHGNREHGWIYVVYGRKPQTAQHVQTFEVSTNTSLKF